MLPRVVEQFRAELNVFFPEEKKEIGIVQKGAYVRIAKPRGVRSWIIQLLTQVTNFLQKQ